MASAFISYAHEDQEFVLLLVGHLQAQGLAVSYDRVALHIGDSLIQAISQEVTEGDFLIAVVSPASLVSPWCQHEVALAMNQGINQQRVKVLPVRFGGAAMPPMLQNTVWGDADAFDVATLARRLAAAMTAHLEGREAEAAREAGAVEDAGGTPVHAEVAGDVTVTQFDALAGKVMDVLGMWADVWAGVANIRDVLREQRHLRWAIEVLPDRARAGLPLVHQLSTGDANYFGGGEPGDVERDIFEELRSVRTQLAQGLPVSRRWFIDACIGVVPAGGRDATAHLWRIARGNESRSVHVYVSGSAMASSDEHLPREVAEAKTTNGRSVVTTLIALDDPPAEVSVTTAGVSLTMPD